MPDTLVTSSSPRQGDGGYDPVPGDLDPNRLSALLHDSPPPSTGPLCCLLPAVPGLGRLFRWLGGMLGP